MRARMVVMVAVALVAACKSGKDAGKATEVVKNTADTAVPAPKVSVGTVIAKDDGKPPFLVILDGDGKPRLAAAATWTDLDANKVEFLSKPQDLDTLDKITRESYVLGHDPLSTIKEWNEHGGEGVDLSALEEHKPSAADQDDPPPPPPEEGDESGGTGTAMALDEGKMGKKDSDRAEGEYKMKKDDTDPQLARQQALEQARTAGVLGASGLTWSASGLGSAAPDPFGMPSRVAQTAGAVVRDGKIDRMRAMIVIPPTAKAMRLIAAVRDTSDAIAVSFNGKLRPLNLQFSVRDTMNVEPASYWMEARLSTKGLVIEAVPDKAVEVASLDQLGAAIEKARAAHGSSKPDAVDILVDPDVDVQHVIDVAVALELAGVNAIGFGPMPSTEELARRGHRIYLTSEGQPNVQGDLDKAEVRRVVKGAHAQISACYEKAREAVPALQGTVTVQFMIKPNGAVAAAQGQGVEPAFAACVANVIKSLAFPKQTGGVQVIYPVTFHMI